ncbi:MAG TPA: AAA family ATPase [Propionibacteriaceae bacterium]
MPLLLAPPAPVEPDLIVVGGIPGAGKSTVIARTVGLPGVETLDPDQVRSWLRHRLPDRIHYRSYRPVVHVVQTLRVLARLWRGPVPGQRLVMHDPATRPRRRSLLARVARLRGWTPAMVYVDIDLSSARRGQVERGRVVKPSSFDGHWSRWQQLRPQLVADHRARSFDGFSSVELVDRERAAAALFARLGTVASAGQQPSRPAVSAAAAHTPARSDEPAQGRSHA